MPAIGRSALWVLTFLHHLAVPCKYEGISTCIQWLSSYGQDFDEITVCFLRQGDLCLELPTTGEHGRRHFGSKRVLRRKFLEHGLSRYPNSTSTFQLSRLSISCDVNPNPGPQLNVIALLVLGLNLAKLVKHLEAGSNKDVKVAHLNVCSLQNKIDGLRCLQLLCTGQV